MKRSEEIATDLLDRFNLADDRRAPLIKRLTNLVEATQAYKDGKAFQTPPGKTEANKQLNKLSGALSKVRSIMDNMNPVVFRAVNRSLYEGEIPLLDEASARAGHLRSNAPNDIAEVLYDLSGHLLDHIQTIKPAKAKPGPTDDFTRFLTSELATVYSYASQTKPTDRTDYSDGVAYGPFLEFVDAARQALSLDMSAEYLVDKAVDPVTCASSIAIISPLPIEKD